VKKEILPLSVSSLIFHKDIQLNGYAPIVEKILQYHGRLILVIQLTDKADGRAFRPVLPLVITIMADGYDMLGGRPLKPTQQPCRLCGHWEYGYCKSIDDYTGAHWTGCVRWILKSDNAEVSGGL